LIIAHMRIRSQRIITHVGVGQCPTFAETLILAAVNVHPAGAAKLDDAVDSTLVSPRFCPLK